MLTNVIKVINFKKNINDKENILDILESVTQKLSEYSEFMENLDRKIKFILERLDKIEQGASNAENNRNNSDIATRLSAIEQKQIVLDRQVSPNQPSSQDDSKILEKLDKIEQNQTEMNRKDVEHIAQDSENRKIFKIDTDEIKRKIQEAIDSKNNIAANTRESITQSSQQINKSHSKRDVQNYVKINDKNTYNSNDFSNKNKYFIDINGIFGIYDPVFEIANENELNSIKLNSKPAIHVSPNCSHLNVNEVTYLKTFDSNCKFYYDDNNGEIASDIAHFSVCQHCLGEKNEDDKISMEEFINRTILG